MSTWGAVAREAAQRESAVRQEHAPGLVAVATVRAFNEGHSDGKRRPVVLVNIREGHHGELAWAVMGLTTKATYGNGDPRIPLVDWQQAGLRRPGFIWGGRLVIVPEEDVGEVVGPLSWRDALEVRRSLSSHREAQAFLAAVAQRERGGDV